MFLHFNGLALPGPKNWLAFAGREALRKIYAECKTHMLTKYWILQIWL